VNDISLSISVLFGSGRKGAPAGLGSETGSGNGTVPLGDYTEDTGEVARPARPRLEHTDNEISDELGLGGVSSGVFSTGRPAVKATATEQPLPASTVPSSVGIKGTPVSSISSLPNKTEMDNEISFTQETLDTSTYSPNIYNNESTSLLSSTTAKTLTTTFTQESTKKVENQITHSNTKL
jgi:hypothetical protein